MIKLINGDCLEALKNIDDKSVNLILIDPPYNIKKAKWDSWKTTEAYVEFMGKVFKELERVLKDNGSFYFFHNDFLQIVELQNYINKHTSFKFKQLITWNKTKFKRYAWTNRNPEKCKDRNWFPNIEYCLFYTFKDEPGLETFKRDEKNFLKLKEYFRNEKEQTEKEIKKELKEVLKWSTHFHWFAKGLMWRLPIEKHYITLQQTFKGHFLKPYKEIKEEYKKERKELKHKIEQYEAERYTFNLEPIQNNISCVWESNETNTGKEHSCQKPQDILERIIKTSSNEGDIVLDCFAGSGSTGVACVNTNRRFIGIELDKNYFEIAEKRIEEAKR